MLEIHACSYAEIYPEMATVPERYQMMEKAGYKVLETYALSQLAAETFASKALDDLQKE